VLKTLKRTIKLESDHLNEWKYCVLREVEVIDIGVDKDHFHMSFKAKPTLNIPRYINAIKTITLGKYRENFLK
jgi:REP element-mobilizing transposase RayT